MEYDIFTAMSPYDLRAIVRAAIEQGWQPLGGLAIGNDLFAQAMTRQKLQWTITTTPLVSDSTVVSLNEVNERMLAR